ncbi:MAG: amidohydrolase [Actinomycetes bacterium]
MSAAPTGPGHGDPAGIPEDLAARVKGYEDELVAFRRDLHAHPELSWAEVRTTRVLRERLVAAGLTPNLLPGGTGLTCDIGAGEGVVALRADLDALPIVDGKSVDYASTVPGVCHACGHDVHATAVLGAGLVLADLDREGRLPGRVRLVFQPAEESSRSGALAVLDAGGGEDVERIFALHCDPRTTVGQVGLRTGAITGSADHLSVRLTGPGGHTARPHLTADLVYALGRLVTELPAALSRRIDPRASLSLVWGRIAAGRVANAIPQSGEAEGTVRCLDTAAWQDSPALVDELVHALVAPYGVQAEVTYTRNVPPVDNEPVSVDLLAAAVREVEGPDALVGTEQSLGGEDFAWYLGKIPGALARLGVCPPGVPEMDRLDLHQGFFDADERAIPVGVRVLVAVAFLSFS